MVDHEISTEEKFFLPEDKYLPQHHLSFSRQHSVREEIKDILKEINATNEYFINSSVYDAKAKSTEKWNTEFIRKKLATISVKLLTRSPTDYESTASAKKIKDLEKAYKFVVENFLCKMDKFLRSSRELRNEVITTLKEFRLYSRGTAYITLATSVTSIALVTGSLMQKIFHFSWSPKISLFYSVVAGVSFTTSLLALTYMRRTTTEISRDVRKQNRFLLDIILAHRKGDWIDIEVLGLFPFGINLNLIEDKILEDNNYFQHKYSWRKYICSAIILSNIQKDAKLLYDDTFLTTVKLFVENPAAEIWWSRMKIKRLLNEIRQKADNISSKEFISGHENYKYRTAMYLYPVLIPWLISSWNSEEMRFICNSLAGILAAVDLKNDESEELKDLKKISQSFEKDLKEINKICEILNSSYD